MALSQLKLYCFPYAGGSSFFFDKFKLLFTPSIQVIPVELPGRGRRIMEPFYNNWDEVNEDLRSQLSLKDATTPYAFFGHSMGGMIAYMLSKTIQTIGLPMPRHLFISGKGAPHVLRPDKKKYYNSPTTILLDELKRLDGTPSEFFENAELIELFLPLLRSDFRLAETDIARNNIVSVNTPISIITGTKEDLLPAQIEEWKYYTQAKPRNTYFCGWAFLY